MGKDANIFNTKYWRIGRWLITISIIAFSLLYLPNTQPLQWGFGALIMMGLCMPELLRVWPQAKGLLGFMSLTADILIVTLLALTINSTLSILFLPVLIATTSLASWPIMLGAGLIALAIQSSQLFYFNRSAPFFTEPIIFMISLLLAILTAVYLSHHLLQGNKIQAEQEQKLQIRSDKYLMRAHEIRTPLSLIQASVELILDGAPGPITNQQKVFLENIDENCHQITLLAENMLTKGKLESGIFQPTLQSADIRDTVREVVDSMRTFTDRRKQTIRTYYPQMLPLVDVDSVLMRQTLINLIQNAIRHTSSGGQIVVSVSENDLGLLIAVTDDGDGMSLEQRQQLFNRFVSGSGGTGLGLLIVKQIVELHGGKVLVDTSLGKGTTFFVTLPFSDQNRLAKEHSHG